MGKNVVDAAKQAGVSHLVFSSVCIVEQCRMVPHWNTKYEIEQYIRASGIPFTMVRPALFMDNFTSTGLFPSKGDKMFGMLSPDRKQQLISVNDIGYVVSTIMLNPEEYLGKTIELASDYLCGNEMAQIRSKLLNGTDGTEGTYTGNFSCSITTSFQWKLDVDNGLLITHLLYVVIPFTEHHIKAMVDFMQTHDYVADIPKLKKEFPKLRTWEEFVKEEIVEK